MSLTKEQVCVFIENEAHLQQAREVLERYKQEIKFSMHKDFLIPHITDIKMNNLSLGKNGWDLVHFPENFIKRINLSELEQILKYEQ